jgi:hypothetical protein
MNIIVHLSYAASSEEAMAYIDIFMRTEKEKEIIKAIFPSLVRPSSDCITLLSDHGIELATKKKLFARYKTSYKVNVSCDECGGEISPEEFGFCVPDHWKISHEGCQHGIND